MTEVSIHPDRVDGRLTDHGMVEFLSDGQKFARRYENAGQLHDWLSAISPFGIERFGGVSGVVGAADFQEKH